MYSLVCLDTTCVSLISKQGGEAYKIISIIHSEWESVQFNHTCSVRCVTCASSSFSPLAGGAVAGIFLADEGRDVGVEDLGVVEVDLDAPTSEFKVYYSGMVELFTYSLSESLTCSGGAGCMVGLLWQVEDLLTGVGWGDGILTLSGSNRVIFFTVVIGIKELLKPLDEVKIVLKSAFDQFLHRNNLNQGCGTKADKTKQTKKSLKSSVEQ